MTIPAQPKIYHITHVDNLAPLVSAGCLWSDAQRLRQGFACQVVGMSAIKKRRLEERVMDCHPDTMVGEYAPFYFCPRSIMLYILHRANHPDVQYQGGQRPIVHLQADLARTIAWADQNAVRWAFTDRNAGARIAQFFNSWQDLDKINWNAVRSTDFSDTFVKEHKQAEFLLYEAFPWELVEKIGVIDSTIAGQTNTVIAGCSHRPPVRVERGWYY